jgi:hypothetical protein
MQKYNSTDLEVTSGNHSAKSSARKPADAYVYCTADGARSRVLPVGPHTQAEQIASVEPGDEDSDMLSRELAAIALDAVSGHVLGSSSRFIRTGSHMRLPVLAHASSQDLTSTHSMGGGSSAMPMTVRERIHMLASGTFCSPRRGSSDALPDDASVHLQMDQRSSTGRLASQDPSD